MMNANTQRTLGVLLILVLLGIIGFLLWQKSSSREQEAPDAEVVIMAEFPGKIVYATEAATAVEDLRNDCSRRDGEFNTCGTPCAPDAEICAQVCAYTCEFETEDNEEDSTTWTEASFAGGRATLKYPSSLLEHGDQDDTIILKHTVPYKHMDPCDFQGGAPDLDELTDFYVIFEVLDVGLEEAVRQKEAESFVADYMENGQFKIAEGFIAEFESGDLSGHEITFGVENCGMYKYYFPLSDEKTLVIERKFVTELRDSVMREKAENLPGLILPEREQQLFEEILQTFTTEES